MSSTEENIDRLARAVQGEAHAEAEQILADAKVKAQAVRQRAQDQAARERAEILAEASQEAERVRSQAVAAAQLKARTLLLERREVLLKNVFSVVQQKLVAVRQQADFEQIVRHLLHEALTHLGADKVQVRADERTNGLLTAQLLAELSQELGIQLQLGPLLDQGTGVVVETMDGHRQYDNTLEARLARSQSSLRYPVYQLLIGQPA